MVACDDNHVMRCCSMERENYLYRNTIQYKLGKSKLYRLSISCRRKTQWQDYAQKKMRICATQRNEYLYPISICKCRVCCEFIAFVGFACGVRRAYRRLCIRCTYRRLVEIRGYCLAAPVQRVSGATHTRYGRRNSGICGRQFDSHSSPGALRELWMCARKSALRMCPLYPLRALVKYVIHAHDIGWYTHVLFVFHFFFYFFCSGSVPFFMFYLAPAFFRSNIR